MQIYNCNYSEHIRDFSNEDGEVSSSILQSVLACFNGSNGTS